MNLPVAVPFWLAAVALLIVAARRRRPRPARTWWLDWADHDHRQRRCVGALRVTGPVVYYHFGRDDTGRLVLVYIGKAVVFARRMRQEAHERMADDFVMTFARTCPPDRLSATERAEIERYAPLRHNRQHNGKRVAA